MCGLGFRAGGTLTDPLLLFRVAKVDARSRQLPRGL